MFTDVYWQLEHDGKYTRLYHLYRRIHLNKIETRAGLRANVSPQLRRYGDFTPTYAVYIRSDLPLLLNSDRACAT